MSFFASPIRTAATLKFEGMALPLGTSVVTEVMVGVEVDGLTVAVAFGFVVDGIEGDVILGTGTTEGVVLVFGALKLGAVIVGMLGSKGMAL